MLDRSMGADTAGPVIFPFEDTGDNLSLLPLAARRALDVAGFRLSLEGYQSLGEDDRRGLASAGARDVVDTAAVERVLRRSTVPATRIRPVPDPDPLVPPEQLNSALGSRRAVDPAVWGKLRSLDRYALVHVLRRSIARDDASILAAAAAAILPPNPPKQREVQREHRDAAVERRSSGSDAPPVRRGRAEVERERDIVPKAARMAELELANDGDRASGGGSFYDDVEGIPAVLLSFGAAAHRAAPPAEARHSPPPLPKQVPPPKPSSPSDRTATKISPAAPIAPPSGGSTHVNSEGEVHMIDVADKVTTKRRAVAGGVVTMAPAVAERVLRNDAPKGEVLATARIAGIMAAKRTHELIPLCHPLALTSIEVAISTVPNSGQVHVTATVEATDRTGVEMEALTAASVACLTIYDMVKGLDKEMVISDIKLLEKSGGRGGTYVRNDG